MTRTATTLRRALTPVRGAATLARRAAPPRRFALPVVAAALCAYGGVAWHAAAGAREPRAGTALVDAATTADVKGQVTQAVSAVFSYNHADPGRTDAAVRLALTGAARGQYTKLFTPTRQAADKQKSILTTTVTHSGVTSLRGPLAQVLVYADQRSTGAAEGSRSSSGAVILVHAERAGGTWRISGIDTFT
jgi:Mce-associated membrane protein